MTTDEIKANLKAEMHRRLKDTGADTYGNTFERYLRNAVDVMFDVAAEAIAKQSVRPDTERTQIRGTLRPESD